MDMKQIAWGIFAGVAMAGTAIASPTLQLDVQQIHIQVQNNQGVNSAFGGLSHTGSIQFSFQSAVTFLGGVLINGVNAGFSGTLSNFVGSVNLNNGHVTGGSLAVQVNGGSDSYTCDIVPNVGAVGNFIGGGFQIQGLTFNGHFSDNLFGNVDVSPWGGNNLPGSFLQFNFDPNANGSGTADMDMFVDVVPMPPLTWTSAATLAGIMAVGYVRRRRGA
jgi:hypothetical protein